MKVLVMPAERESHPEEEPLERYAMGKLSAGEAESLEEHLLTCDDCRRRLSETDEYLLALRQADKRNREQQPARRGGLLTHRPSRRRQPKSR